MEQEMAQAVEILKDEPSKLQD
jgi:chromosome segregation ATPase